MFGFTSVPRSTKAAAKQSQSQGQPAPAPAPAPARDPDAMSALSKAMAFIFRGQLPYESEMIHRGILANQRSQQASREAVTGFADEISGMFRPIGNYGGGMGGGMGMPPVDNRSIASFNPNDFTSAGYDVVTPRVPPMADRSPMGGGQMPMGGGPGPGGGNIPTSRALFPAFAAALAAANPEDREALTAMMEAARSSDPTKVEFMNLGGGYGVSADPFTGQTIAEFRAPREPRYQALNPGQVLYEIGGGQAGQPSGDYGGFDGFYNNYLAGVEGGFAPDDGNGAPVNFGINQGANPDVDVRNLSQAQAKEILHERYWKPSGADQLPPALGAIHGDTAINMGLGAADALLKQSGGDPQAYLQLREQRYRSIAQNDPSKARFLNTWLDRNQQLAQFVGGQSQSSGPPGARRVAEGAPIQPPPPPRPATPEEKAAYGIPEKTPAQIRPDGSMSILGGARPPTVDATQAAAFTYRVLTANDRLNALADEGVFKPQTVTSQLVRDDGDGVLRIVARTDNDRRFIQAAKEWLAPILRRDTGAAVTDSELANYMDIYIPRFEDNQATIKQKAEARQDAMIALAGQARGVFGDVYGDRKFVSKYPSATRKRDGSPLSPDQGAPGFFQRLVNPNRVRVYNPQTGRLE